MRQLIAGSLLILLLLAGTFARPVKVIGASERCSAKCSGSGKLFTYEDGKAYVYKFRSSHSTAITKEVEDNVEYTLEGVARIEKQSGCEFVLRLESVTAKEVLVTKAGRGEPKEFPMAKTMLEERVLRFGFDDGRVTSVCPESADSDYAVNVKRAILSQLQVSMDSLEVPTYLIETDVTGECITEYTTADEPPKFVVVTKKKSMAGCARKYMYYSDMRGKSYQVPTELRQMALLDGDYQCKIRIERQGPLISSECTEKHLFRPFSDKRSGAAFLITQSLEFKNKEDAKPFPTVPVTQSDLIFAHKQSSPDRYEKESGQPAELLGSLCKATDSSQVPKLFTSLVRRLRGLNLDQLTALHTRVAAGTDCPDNKERLMSLFHDALPMARSEAAVQFLISELLKGHADKKLTDWAFWVFSLSTIRYPTAPMIAATQALLNNTKSYPTAPLMVGAMIYKYCELNEGCMQNPDVIKTMTLMEAPLGTDCTSKDKAQKDKILITLRAVGNVGASPGHDKLIKVLSKCINNQALDDHVRVAAVDSLRRFKCTDDVDEPLYKAFRDVQNDPEVRIQAYKSLIRCPSTKTFESIIQDLENERSQQVGSFVWSHLTNLAETGDKFRGETRDLLRPLATRLAQLQSKFNLDLRSYSRNFEKTLIMGNLAAKLDADVIFGHESFIPRSAAVNLTMDLFGRSVNVLELGVRAPQLELLEKLLGVTRPGKAPKDDDPDVKKMDAKFAGRKKQSGTVSFYTRMFGNEIYYRPDIQPALMTTARGWSAVTSKEGFVYNMDRNVLLTEIIVSVPTVTGHPIELQVDTTVSARANFKAQLNVKEPSVKLNCEPSAAIRIVGRMRLDAHCTKIGIMSEYDAQTSTKFGGQFSRKLEIDSGGLKSYSLNFQIDDTPKDMKIFSYKSSVSVLHNSGPRPQKSTAELVTGNYCTGENTQNVFGAKFCLDYSYPKRSEESLPFPLGRPAEVSIVLKEFAGYKLEYLRRPGPGWLPKHFLINLAQPGRNKDVFRFEVKKSDPNTESTLVDLFSLKTPWGRDYLLSTKIADGKLTGEAKLHKWQGTLTGEYKYDKVADSKSFNIKFNAGKESASIEYSRTPEQINLKVDKSGDVLPFTVRMVHERRKATSSVYSEFGRFRHKTTITLPKGNEFEASITMTKGKNPGKKAEGEVNLLWKKGGATMVDYKGQLDWTSGEEKSVMDPRVKGMRKSLTLKQTVQNKDKPSWELNSGFSHFVSEGFNDIMYGQASIVESAAWIRFPKNASKNVEAKFNTKLDLVDLRDADVVLDTSFVWPRKAIDALFSAQAQWKLDKDSSKFLKKIKLEGATRLRPSTSPYRFLLDHEMTNSKTALTTALLSYPEKEYKIVSDLRNGTHHILTLKLPATLYEMKTDIKETREKELVTYSLDRKASKNGQPWLEGFTRISFNVDQMLFQLAHKSVRAPGQDLVVEGQISTQIWTNIGLSGGSKVKLVHKFGLEVPLWKVKFVVDQEHEISSIYTERIEGALKSKIIYTAVEKKSVYGYNFDTKVNTDQLDYMKANASIVGTLKLFSRGSLTDIDNLSFSWVKEGVKSLKEKLTASSPVFGTVNYNAEVVQVDPENTRVTANLLVDLYRGTPREIYIERKATVLIRASPGIFALDYKGEKSYKRGQARTPFSYLVSLRFDYLQAELSFDDPEFIIPNFRSGRAFFNSSITGGRLYQIKLWSELSWKRKDSPSTSIYSANLLAELSNKFNFFNAVFNTSHGNLAVKYNFVAPNYGLSLSTKWGETVYFRSSIASVWRKPLSDGKQSSLEIDIASSNEILKELLVKYNATRTAESIDGKGEFKFVGKSKNWKLTVKDQITYIYTADEINYGVDHGWDSNIPYVSKGRGKLDFSYKPKEISSEANGLIVYDSTTYLTLDSKMVDMFAKWDFTLDSRFRKLLSLTFEYSRTKKGEANVDRRLKGSLQYDDYSLTISKGELIRKEENKRMMISYELKVNTTGNMKDFHLTGSRSYNTGWTKFLDRRGELRSKLRVNSKDVWNVELYGYKPTYIVTIDVSQISEKAKLQQVDIQIISNNLEFGKPNWRDMSLSMSFYAPPLVKRVTRKLEFFSGYTSMTERDYPGFNKALVYLNILTETEYENHKKFQLRFRMAKTGTNSYRGDGLLEVDIGLLNLKYPPMQLNFTDITDKEAAKFQGKVTINGKPIYTAVYERKTKDATTFFREFSLTALNSNESPKTVKFTLDVQNLFNIKFNGNIEGIGSAELTTKMESDEKSKKYTSDAKLSIRGKQRFKVTCSGELTRLDAKSLTLKHKISGEYADAADKKFPFSHSVNYDRKQSSRVINGRSYKFEVKAELPLPKYGKRKINFEFDGHQTNFQTSLNVEVDGNKWRSSSWKVDVESLPFIDIEHDFAVADIYSGRFAVKFSKAVVNFEMSVKDLFLLSHKHNVETSVTKLKLTFRDKFEYELDFNLGRLIRYFTDKKNIELFPVGHEYYFRGKWVSASLKRASPRKYILTFTWPNAPEPVTVTFSYNIEISTKSTYSGSLAITGPSETNIKTDLSLSHNSPPSVIEIVGGYGSTNIPYSQLGITLGLPAGASKVVELRVKFTGETSLNLTAQYDVVAQTYSHSANHQDTKFKTLLWKSGASCTVGSLFKKRRGLCQFTFFNRIRDAVLSIEIKEMLNRRYEISWNTKRNQGFIVHLYRKDPGLQLDIATPVRKINIMASSTGRQPMVAKIDITTSDHEKTEAKKGRFTFTITRSLVKIDNRLAYSLQVQLESSLLKKPLIFTVSANGTQAPFNCAFDARAFFGAGTEAFARLSFNGVQPVYNRFDHRLYVGVGKTSIEVNGFSKVAYDDFEINYDLKRSQREPMNFQIKIVPFKSLLIKRGKEFKIEHVIEKSQNGLRMKSDFVSVLDEISVSRLTEITYYPIKIYHRITTKKGDLVAHLRAVSVRSLQGEVYRLNTREEKSTDVTARLILDENNVVQGSLFWRPELLTDARKYVEEVLNPTVVQGYLTRRWSAVSFELNELKSQFVKTFITNIELQGIIDYMKEAVNDLEKLPQALKTFYQNDEMFIKTVLGGVGKFLEQIKITELFSSAGQKATSAAAVIGDVLHKWIVQAEIYRIVYNPIKNLANQFDYETLRSIFTTSVNFGKLVVEVAVEALKIVSKYSAAVRENVTRLRENVRNWFTELVNRGGETAFTPLIVFLQDLRENFRSLVDEIPDLSAARDFVKTRLIQAIQDLKNLKDYHDQLASYLTSYLATSNEDMKTTMEVIKLALQGDLATAADKFFKPQEAKMTYDLSKAQIDFRFYLPVSLSRAYIVARWLYYYAPTETLQWFSRPGKGLAPLFYRINYLVNNYGSLKKLRNLLPPFDRTAWVVSGRYLLTMNGAAVELVQGTSEYLLARDFRNRGFLLSAIVSGEQKVTFNIHHSNQRIQLNSDGVVLFHESSSKLSKIELPFEVPDLKITRDGQKISIECDEGITITYYTQLNIFSLRVDGRWHGQIAGLLGTNDFDRLCDHQTPDGKVLQSIKDLKKDWVIRGGLPVTRQPGSIWAEARDAAFSECFSMFASVNSPMSRCFSTVDPEPFQEACQLRHTYSTPSADLTKQHNCRLAAAYTLRCNERGVMLRLGANCVMCSGARQGAQIPSPVNSDQLRFNYIFAIEHTSCVASKKAEIKEIAKILTYKRPTDTLTLIGFNGRGVFQSVHERTIDSLLSNNLDRFQQALEVSLKSNSLTTGQGNPTLPYEAIYNAIKRPTAPKSSDIVLLFTCTKCEAHPRYTYSVLGGLLQSENVPVHYFTNETFRPTESGATGLGQNEVVFGVDQSKHFVADGKTAMEREMIRGVLSPKDMCTPLARISEGAVWALNQMQSRDLYMKRSREAINRRIKKVPSGKLTQLCSCRVDKYGSGEVDCKVAKRTGRGV